MIVKDIQIFRQVIEDTYNSEKYQKRRRKMDKFLKYYRGEFWPEQGANHKATDSEIFCNYFFSTIMTIAPLITDSKPIWHLRPRKWYLQKLFTVYEDVLEYLWDKLDCEMKFFKVELSALIFGLGLWKIFFDPETDEVRIDIEDPRGFIMAPGFDDPWEAPWCGMRSRRSIA